MVLTAEQPAAVSPVRLKRVGEFSGVDFTAMSCPCTIMFRARSEAAAREFADSAVAWVRSFEARCSRFRPDSVISRINRSAGDGWVELDADIRELFALCDWFHWTTHGVFDPTAGPLLALWDYHAPHPALPAPAAIEAARRLVGWPRIERDDSRVRLPVPGMAIDLGGIGKEYAVDRVIRMAVDAGIRDCLVNFGHDLRVTGSPPEGGAWRIGLENPKTPGHCWCGLAVRDAAVCTSGDYLRFVEIDGRRYGHIADPRTGYPVSNGSLSVSVIAPSCTEAGMLCTAAFILGPEEGSLLISGTFGAAGCIWTEAGVVETGGFRPYVIRNPDR